MQLSSLKKSGLVVYYVKLNSNCIGTLLMNVRGNAEFLETKLNNFLPLFG